jgi:transcriptional regulator, gntR family
MFIIDLSSRLAIYEQIVQQVEEGILKGLLKPEEQLPSVRALSLELALNPNTVSKAYTELERRGIIYTAVGKGCFIAKDAHSIISQKLTASFTEFLQQVKKYKTAGVPAEKLISLIQQLYKEETQ